MIQETIIWQSISKAPKDQPLWLYASDFVDEDFNPSGIVDGFWNDDNGWTIWKWNGCHDCYDTVEGAGPELFAIKVSPVSQTDKLIQALENAQREVERLTGIRNKPIDLHEKYFKGRPQE